jgi:hypothetical protein
MKSSFTRHAWSRVIGRLSLAPAEVAALLDYDLVVDVGIEPGTRRVHRLFYSVPDGMCFVAVQDQECGAVVTVLPIDFHETLAWPVSTAAQETARQLAEPRDTDVPTGGTVDPEVVEAPRAAPAAPFFRITAYVRDDLDNVRVVKLGSWPSAPYEQQPEQLSRDGMFLQTVQRWLRERNIAPERLDSVYVRVGQRTTPVRINPV